MWNITPIQMLERKRNITELEEAVLRCVHHEFLGLTQAECARHLGITPSKVSRTITSIERKAKTCSPIRIMLPILTKRQFKIFELVVKDGMSFEAIAKRLGTSIGNIRSAVYKLRKKGKHIPNPVRHDQYIESMDDKVKINF